LPARAYSLAIEAAARTLDLMAGSLPELFAGFVRPRDAAAIVRIQDNIGGAVRLWALCDDSIFCAEIDGRQGKNITAQVSLSIDKETGGRPLSLVTGSRMLSSTAIWLLDKFHVIRAGALPIDPAPLTRPVVEGFAASSGRPGLIAQTGQNRNQANGEGTWPTIAL
jgi:hypothetical protein